MSVSLERFKNTYLPIFHNGEVPIVRLEEETDSEQGEQPIEVVISKKRRVLEWISSLVLTESQRDKAENVIPIIIPLFATLCAYNYYKIVMHYNYYMHDDHTSEADFILSTGIFFIITLLTTLLLGIPLEVAHGKLKMLCFICVVIIHCILLNISHHYGYFEFDERVVNIALVSLHLTNIVMNWKEMEYKVHRFIILLILLGPSHISTWIYYLFEHGLMNPINIPYLISFTNGIIFGYYWFYGNKKSIFKYVLTIMTLSVFIINLIFRRYH